MVAALILTLFDFPMLGSSVLSKLAYFSIDVGMSGWAIILAETQSLIDNRYCGLFESIVHSNYGVIVLAIYILCILLFLIAVKGRSPVRSTTLFSGFSGDRHKEMILAWSPSMVTASPYFSICRPKVVSAR